MTRLIPHRLLLSAATLVLAGGLVGCASNDYADRVPLTESDAARIEAERMQEKQKMLARAEELVSEGEANRARGQALVDQGNTVEGEPLITEGNVKIAQGNALRDMANEIETDVEPIDLQVASGSGSGSTTRPSN